MRRRRLPFAVGVVVASALALLAGCTESAMPSWSLVTPPGMVPAVLFAGADGVFVGGQTIGSAAPVLLARAGVGWQEMPVTPMTGYGQVATLVAGAADPAGRLVLMGTATGGAHLNPRWTTWIGDGAGIVEEPQSPETFGGWNAGGITGVTFGAEPAIVGAWSVDAGATGLAVWRHQGATWSRQPDPPVFVGAPPATTESATAATAVGSTTVIVGLETQLVGGSVRQRAELWRSDGGPWTRLDLDTSSGSASAADTAATGVTCTDADCLVVGRRDGALVAWRIRGGLIQPVALPARTVDHYTGNPLVAREGSITAIAIDAVLLTSRNGTSWSDIALPTGEIRGLAMRGDTVLVLLREASGAQQVYQHPAA